MSEVELLFYQVALGLLATGLTWVIASAIARGRDVVQIKAQLAALPTTAETHLLAISITELTGTIKEFRETNRENTRRLDQRIDTVGRSYDRVERYLLDKGL